MYLHIDAGEKSSINLAKNFKNFKQATRKNFPKLAVLMEQYRLILLNTLYEKIIWKF